MKKGAKSISIRTLLIIAFLFMMIFPLIILTFANYKKQNDTYKEQVSSFLLQTVQQTHRSLDANLSEVDRQTWPLLYQESLDFVREPAHTQYSYIQASKLFRDEVYMNLFRGRMNQIRSIYFLTHNGNLLSSDTHNTIQQLNQDNVDAITRELRENPLKMRWFSPKKALFEQREGYQTSIESSVIAARQVFDSNLARLQGTLFIQMNHRFLRDVLQTVQIGKTGALLVMDEAGDLLYKQDSPHLHNESVMIQLKSLPASTEGTMQLDGKWLVAYETSKISGWKMIAIIPLSELLEPNRATLFSLLVIAGIGVLFAIFVSIYQANIISLPIIRLAGLMTTASTGNLDVRETKEGFREIEVLQDNFNLLLGRIQHLLEENEREQSEKREAMLQALQMQIHPHFLYNTLDTIYWMSKKYKADTVSKLVAALGRFFRLSLDAGMEWTTIEKEFEHVRTYLEIQSIRYRNKVTYTFTIEAGVNRAMIMPLVLQPIVENAWLHGIARTESGSGVIGIEAKKVHDTVQIQIADTGRGMNEGTLELVVAGLNHPPSGDHIGLRNVHQRLATAYGKGYGLEIASSPGTGTTVTMTIPYKEVP
ncbi:sensor histidine kinase [Brevibacillus choshinensis]|uniref:sensor histidine kinase n=1 Tax=Brevibacillus choshinensis TaxID=54911 RepID=UPI002E1E3322|nr:sensor histidine kinase [Brevibacillus choshinensis]